MTKLQGKTVFITGGSRGIGREIALKAARDGAQIVIAAKTGEPHPTLEGTIYTVAREIEDAGGRCLPLKVDIRDEVQIYGAVEQAVHQFGGIDVLVNNASAISLTPTLLTHPKKFDLMFDVNVRGTFLASQACLPHLMKAENPHVLTLSPPLNMKTKWFEQHVAYTMTKYGMSMCVLGMAAEFKEKGVAFNALWPVSMIATEAFKAIDTSIPFDCMRKPEIVAEAAYEIVTRPSREWTGNFFTDEQVLKEAGFTDFSHFAVNPEKKLLLDLFLD
ncbi:SDR family oxidoreductase [Candidatus Paracaedibacter symbiosus]|uniref:SDR family oxidoreductase n=1 Tax=Candidatus Paracaedibacter symbiosus TaxID=244582 RepID=UPI0005097FD5|nr:NAD(P)-dependent oxidoreductase [Candidatus Paracaedibacter symbiosus]